MTSRKRKREMGEADIKEINYFTNDAFSSTPKKHSQRKRSSQFNTSQIYLNPCLEMKSIKDLVHEKENQLEVKESEINPFEVVRKPPKKKKRNMNEVCFENPALNLEGPERPLNPFEVPRHTIGSSQPEGFVNNALNIKMKDSRSINPYEIQRTDSKSDLNHLKESLGLSECQPTNIKIALPFPPNIGCRLDFKNISLSQLYSNEKITEKHQEQNRSLSSISEESFISIGKELDRYQLEIENSINEAKQNKNTSLHPEDSSTSSFLNLVTNPKDRIFSKQLNVREMEEHINQTIKKEGSICLENKNIDPIPVAYFGNKGNRSEKCTDRIISKKIIPTKLNHLDVNGPSPFIRSYRPAEISTKCQIENSSARCVNSLATQSKTSTEDSKKPSISLLIRKSIQKHKEENNQEAKQPGNEENLKNGFFKSIRQSFRRKTKQRSEEGISFVQNIDEPNLSIVDTKERTLKFKSNFSDMETLRMQSSSENENKGSLRSLRYSTRDLINTVFHKSHDWYELGQ